MKRLFAIYVTLISLLGCALFLYTWPFSDVNVQNEWFLLLLFAGAAVLLSRYTIYLPPNGNTFTLESSVYLALLFTHGLHFSLIILLISSFVMYFWYPRKTSWFNHVFNFSVYTMMIFGSYYAYIVFGGVVGKVSIYYFGAYIASFAAFFVLNVLLMTIYFSLRSSTEFRLILLNTIKELIYIYMVELTASLILAILFVFDTIFGLLLYMFIMLLLSAVFRQYSHLYERLADDKAYIEKLLNSLPIGIITMDETRSDYFINKSAMLLLCLDQRKIKEKIREGSEENSLFWNLLTSQDSFQQVKISYDSDEGEREFLVSKTDLIIPHKEPIGRIIFFLDVTEAEKISRRIHQSEKLALMGEMAAKAAHEIRNPLAVIHGFLAFMNENLHERDREQYHIPLLLKEIDRINAIVEDMLLIAKPSAPVMKEAYMETIVQDVLSLFEQTLEAKNIRVHVRLDHVPLQLDSKQMMQVLYNLLHNSIEAMEEGGTICIYSDVDETYNMYMYDSGSGIPTHMQETIFEPFITTKSSGTGLGLTIVKRIIENHGGTIALHNSSEQGTTFVIKLPIRR
ncbi:sensor histidine kinase [Anoxybacillus ayderensis G10]|uniref:two-component system sensor histidine kinase NtrB n=1 Tax=Anoxybacillus sp. ST70 TaxID=2864180 RepID=UPI000E238B1C|nr:ATP-binding protein [Anoxybacillus sp. ST70]AXM87718.1 sensor histidine kinase [Anoxybacillus ayderensis G10]MBW9218448.1 GHKL domain-containing protein [Anoxybacillus sp. ST70]